MSLMKAREKAEKPDPATEPQTAANYGTCWRCQGATPKVTLMEVGGMCFPCYSAYKREGQRPQKLPAMKPRQRNFLAQGESEGEAA